MEGEHAYPEQPRSMQHDQLNGSSQGGSERFRRTMLLSDQVDGQINATTPSIKVVILTLVNDEQYIMSVAGRKSDLGSGNLTAN